MTIIAYLHGDTRFLGTWQTQIPKLINMKICTISNVGWITRYARIC
jgi:hypothetical protein